MDELKVEDGYTEHAVQLVVFVKVEILILASLWISRWHLYRAPFKKE